MPPSLNMDPLIPGQFMDGSGFNTQGQATPAPVAAAPAAATVSLNPTTQVDSSVLANPKTSLDIQSLLQDNLNKQDSLFTQIQGFFTPTPEEQTYQQQYQDYQKKINDLAAEQDQLALDTNQQNFELGRQPGMLTSIANSQISDNTLRAGFRQNQLAVQQGALSRQQQVALQTLQNAQANRSQKLEAAKFLYDATRNKLSDTIMLMKATAPENIAQTVDPQTGQMTVIMKNPITGELSRQNLGVVQTPQKQIDNVKFAEDAGVEQQFFTKGNSKTVINATNGQEYSTPEQAAAAGVDIRNWSNVQRGVQSLASQQFAFDKYKTEQSLALQRDQLQVGKFSIVGTGQYDEFGNEMKGIFNTKTGAVTPLPNGADGNPDYSPVFSVQYPDGSVGGQCAVFAEKVCDFGTPSNLLGNNLKDKQATVNKYGLSANQWRNQGAQVGDGIVFNLGQYGHVSVVTGVNPDGTVNVVDSNYGKDEKVQNRVVNINDKNIYGVVRGELKGVSSPSSTNSVDKTAYINAFKNATVGMPVNQQTTNSRQLQSLLKRGDTQGAKELITRLATSTAPVEQQNQAQGRSEALAALDNINSSLKDFIVAGGNTNIFTGTEEQIANKVGATKDPKLAYLANQINQAFINYRRSMTGVAFSPQESAQYEKLFPSIGKVSNFNEAVIQSLQDTMNRNQELFLKNRIGTTNYNALFPPVQSTNGLSTENSLEAQYIDSLPSNLLPQPSSNTNSNVALGGQLVKSAASNFPGAQWVAPTFDFLRNLLK